MKVVRDDATVSDSKTQQLSTQTEIRTDEIEHFTFEKVLRKYDEIILDMVRKQTGFALERMHEEIPDSQSVSAKGKPLNAELILEMLETIQLEFHPDGRQQELQVIGGLFTPESFQAVQNEFANSPDLQRRHEELINRKRKEWSAREASRKLVG